VPARSSTSPTLLALVGGPSTTGVEAAAVEAGFDATLTSTVGALLEELRSADRTVTLLSLDDDGVDEALVRRIADEAASGILLLAAPSVSLERAVLMERVGAIGLLREPVGVDDLRRRLEAARSEGDEVALPEPTPPSQAPSLVGSSEGLAAVLEAVARVARSPAPVLVTGESGTGKELVARAVHWASDRREHPFVPVNCAAIPEHLLESELFGHEKGAFTGAVARRVGRFQRADGGTLFLDEIGDMSPLLQARILRALEEGGGEPVGGDAPVTVDVRVVAATNRALGRAIEDGDFREDLYHRLAVVELHLPPLRERVGDVRELALHFAAHFADRYGRPIRAVTTAALERLASYSWPGNVRELRNVMDRAVLLASNDVVGTSALRLGAGSPRASARGSDAAAAGYPSTFSLEEVEADHIRRVLHDQGGHMGNAADVLGIHRNTLTRKVQEYGLDDGEAS